MSSSKKNKLYLSYLGYGLVITIFTITALYAYISLKNTEESKRELAYSRDYSIVELSRSFNDFHESVHSIFYTDNIIDGKDIYNKYKYLRSVYVSSLYINGVDNEQQYNDDIIKELLNIGNSLDIIGKYLNNGNNIDTIIKNKKVILEEMHNINDMLTYISSRSISSQAKMFKSEDLEKHRNYLINSVIIMGLSGMIIIIILINQINNIKALSFEKQAMLDVIKSRLNAIDASGEGILSIDKYGKINFINQTLKKLHGLSDDNLKNILGEDWLNLYPYFDEEELSTMKSGDKICNETDIYTDKGEILPVEITATKMEDEGIIIIVRDITERKKSVEEKQELQKQFFQAQKMEAVGRLAGGIAHDFNNILASMLGYAEFLVEDLEEDKKKQNYAKRIIQGGIQARQLIDQILAFSRRSETNRAVINISEIVKESISILRATIPTTIDINMDIGHNKAMVMANESQLMQVIMNICVNAKDAMKNEIGTLEISLKETNEEELNKYFENKSEELPSPKDTPEIKISKISEDHTIMSIGTFSKRHKYVKLSIDDTGSGIPLFVMEHVFEPFYTTKAKGKGTGLGLSTTLGVVVAFQGAMVIDSKMGKGTSFKIFLPINEKIGITGNEYGEDITQDDTDYIDDENNEDITIMIVDDQKEVEEVINKMVSRLGYKTISSNSPLDALDIIREKEGKIDLVITDYSMLDMTGLDLANEIYMDFPEMPVIIITGYKKSKLQEVVSDYPSVKEIIGKPVERKRIAKAIKSALSKGKSDDKNIVEFPIKKNA